MRILLLTFPLIAALAACSTPYQEESYLGGVKAVKLTPDTVQISSKSNAYTSSETTWQYALLKSAQTTIESGYGHFAILDADNYSQTDYFATTTYGYYGAYTSVGSYTKPKSTFVIRMYPGRKPAGTPPNVFDARTVWDTLYPQVQKPDSSKRETAQASPGCETERVYNWTRNRGGPGWETREVC